MLSDHRVFNGFRHLGPVVLIAVKPPHWAGQASVQLSSHFVLATVHNNGNKNVARTQLCLHWSVSDLGAFERALAAHDFATVLIEGSPTLAFDAQVLIPLIEHAQSRNVAALVVGDAALARACRADGVHLPWSKAPDAAYAEAREILGTRFIVGVDAGRSRHDAMHLGEAGADYIGFGIPAHVEDMERAAERRLDLVSWWAEIFEVPVVALDVRGAADTEKIAKSKADFVALRLDDNGTSSEQIERAVLAILS